MRLLKDKQIRQLRKLLSYSDKYEINIQFWPDQTVVYIEKDSIELQSYGGGWEYAIGSSIEYLDKITNKEKRINRDNEANNIAQIIKERIKNMGMNRQQFASLMGIQPSIITRWLSGSHNFTTKTLIEIENKLQVKLLNI